jgi:hypothetical protein
MVYRSINPIPNSTFVYSHVFKIIETNGNIPPQNYCLCMALPLHFLQLMVFTIEHVPSPVQPIFPKVTACFYFILYHLLHIEKCGYIGYNAVQYGLPDVSEEYIASIFRI